MCHKCDKKYEDSKKSKKTEKKERRNKKEEKDKNKKGEKLKAKLVTYNVESLKDLKVNAKGIDITDSIWATGAPSLWARGFRGDGVIVGVIDTGIDDTHPILKGKVGKEEIT